YHATLDAPLSAPGAGTGSGGGDGVGRCGDGPSDDREDTGEDTADHDHVGGRGGRAGGQQRHQRRLADQLVGAQAGDHEAEGLVREQQRQVAPDQDVDGQLEQDTGQDDGGEQPLAVQDHDLLQQLHKQERDDGDTDDDEAL